MSQSHYDVIIIGAGPGGSTAALLCARAGLKTLVLEKSAHPRFHIGESILPRNFPLVQELGLEPQLKALPHLKKLGAEFGMGNDPSTRKFTFASGLIPGTETFNIERAHFDTMLASEAKKAGADLRENTAVKKILRLADNDVAVQTDAGDTFSARILLDASGHGTVVGRHLNTRKPIPDPNLHKVAYFNHFENVWRPPGDEDGYPTIIMCDEGWFWLIGLNESRTSVGFVTHPETVKRLKVPADQMLAWAVSRCPVVRHRMRDATGPADNTVLADFSYTCKPHAGPGHFLVGDAGCFLDPIFSTGVTLAMMGAKQAAEQTIAILKNNKSPDTARREYIQFVEGSTSVFWSLIQNYYNHSFRELFMNGTGPLNVHGAVISTLAGQVFPRPPFSLRWRLKFFYLCMHLNTYLPLVPRRPHCTLEKESPLPPPYLRTPEFSAAAS